MKPAVAVTKQVKILLQLLDNQPRSNQLRNKAVNNQVKTILQLLNNQAREIMKPAVRHQPKYLMVKSSRAVRKQTMNNNYLIINSRDQVRYRAVLGLTTPNLDHQ